MPVISTVVTPLFVIVQKICSSSTKKFVSDTVEHMSGVAVGDGVNVGVKVGVLDDVDVGDGSGRGVEVAEGVGEGSTVEVR